MKEGGRREERDEVREEQEGGGRSMQREERKGGEKGRSLGAFQTVTYVYTKHHSDVKVSPP